MFNSSKRTCLLRVMSVVGRPDADQDQGMRTPCKSLCVVVKDGAEGTSLGLATFDSLSLVSLHLLKPLASVPRWWPQQRLWSLLVGVGGTWPCWKRQSSRHVVGDWNWCYEFTALRTCTVIETRNWRLMMPID